jgi:hypothetical protein
LLGYIALRPRRQVSLVDSDSYGTNDALVSNAIRTNEMQVRFVAERLVDEPLVHADEATTPPVGKEQP